MIVLASYTGIRVQSLRGRAVKQTCPGSLGRCPEPRWLQLVKEASTQKSNDGPAGTLIN
jgi:hypothetical protein